VTVIASAIYADVPAVVDMLETVERFYGTTEFGPWAQRADEVRDALFGEPPAAWALLAWDGEQLVGMAAYSFLWPAAGTTRSLFLKELFVVEEHRRAGVGRDLMAALFDVAGKTRCSRVEWQTEVGNAPARAFYNALGVTELDGKVFFRITT
jgi:GNAT superfamily N-acetyltransferase